MRPENGHINTHHFRRVLGHLPTGVTVLTAVTPEGPVGMACNSVTSVSLVPPLLAVCAGRTSETWPQIRDARHFLVNVLASHQGDLARRFSHKGIDRFEAIPVNRHEHGIVIDDAVAWIACCLEAEHEAGDHTIAISRVLHLEAREERSPLVFLKGHFGAFAPQAGVNDPLPAGR